MKIAAFAMVRDECDIIELFVRINCRVFDHIYIVNNNSADTTPLILEKLKAEGYPITVTFSGDNTYNQNGITNSALYSINAMGIYDWVVILDADEFVDEPKDDVLRMLESIPRNYFPVAKWKSWVPCDTNYESFKAPLHFNFNPQTKENHITFKVAIDKGRIPLIQMAHGNHAVKGRDGREYPTMFCGLRINHFPIRSPEQVILKTVMGNYRLILHNQVMTEKKAEQGPVRNFFQLNAILRVIRENNFNITKDQLRFFAYAYNTEIPPSGHDPQTDNTIDEKFGFPEDIIEYKDLAQIRMASLFDKQMDIMHGVITKLYKGQRR